MKYLVADDHAVFRVGLLYLLQRLDTEAEILEASDYAEALEIAEREDSIDLILVDLLMPGIEGYSGISGLRDRSRSAPIIVVSARENPADVQASLDNGAMGS